MRGYSRDEASGVVGIGKARSHHDGECEGHSPLLAIGYTAPRGSA